MGAVPGILKGNGNPCPSRREFGGAANRPERRCRTGSVAGLQGAEPPAKNFPAAADVHALFTDIWYTETDNNQPDNRRRR